MGAFIFGSLRGSARLLDALTLGSIAQTFQGLVWNDDGQELLRVACVHAGVPDQVVGLVGRSCGGVRKGLTSPYLHPYTEGTSMNNIDIYQGVDALVREVVAVGRGSEYGPDRCGLIGVHGGIYDKREGVPHGAPCLERFDRLIPADSAQLIDVDFADGPEPVENGLFRFTAHSTGGVSARAFCGVVSNSASVH